MRWRSPATLRYTPAAGYLGTDSFTYTIDDGAGARATATVRVTVQHANHAPVANDDYIAVGYTGDWPLNVLANDTDPDGDALSIVSFTAAAARHGRHGYAGWQQARVP